MTTTHDLSVEPEQIFVLNIDSPNSRFTIRRSGSDVDLWRFDERTSIGTLALAPLWLSQTNPEAVAWVLHQLSHTSAGYPPGDVAEHIIAAATQADDETRDKIAAGFPEIVAAVNIYQRVYGSPEMLAAYLRGKWAER